MARMGLGLYTYSEGLLHMGQDLFQVPGACLQVPIPDLGISSWVLFEVQLFVGGISSWVTFLVPIQRPGLISRFK